MIKAISLSSGYEIELNDIEHVKDFIINQIVTLCYQNTTSTQEINEYKEYIQSVKNVKTIDDCNEYHNIIQYEFE